MPKANLSKKFLFGIIALIGLAAGIPLILSQSQVQQILTGNAWYTSQSASAACDATTGHAIIKVSFTNQESSRGMLVKVVDTQTGKSVDLGTVSARKTNTGQIDTGLTSINSGYVTFKLTWSDGGSGTDSRSASYPKVSTCTPPTPTPTPTTQPSPTPSTVPTQTPTITPSPVPSASPTPTTCPTPGTVKNIKIQCPYCTPSPNPNQ